MPLNRLIVKQFRNIEACDISLSSGFNFLVGANGSGKTTFLEAIYLLGHGRSFKSAITGRIIQHGYSELFVHGRLNSSTDMPLPVGINKHRDGSTVVKIAGQSGQKLAELAKILPLQLIHPEGFDLLTDGPKHRRAFLDWGVFHSESRFFEVWGRIKRLNKQRNAILKTAGNNRELKFWDQELVKLAEQISMWREKYVEQLIEVALPLCQDFLPEYDIKISFYQGWEKGANYAEVLQNNIERDQQLGYTFSGPHKADLKIRIKGTPVEDILSRGQLKLLVCALRLAQGQHLAKLTQKQCIYLIDDFASELDSQRRASLAACLKETGAQVFVSSITENQISEMISENSKMFHVEHGKIEAVNIESE